MSGNLALIVAAGRGERFGAELPKQYLELGGRPLLRHSLEAFCAHPAIAAVAVVYQPTHRALYEAPTTGLPLLPPISGGASRHGSALHRPPAVAGVDPRRG